MSDFQRAQQAAEVFDAELLNAGTTILSGYADLLALTARQVLSSIDITLAKGSDGNWNFTDIHIFMKNFGAAGSDSPYVNVYTTHSGLHFLVLIIKHLVQNIKYHYAKCEYCRYTLHGVSSISLL